MSVVDQSGRLQKIQERRQNKILPRAGKLSLISPIIAAVLLEVEGFQADSLNFSGMPVRSIQSVCHSMQTRILCGRCLVLTNYPRSTPCERELNRKQKNQHVWPLCSTGTEIHTDSGIARSSLGLSSTGRRSQVHRNASSTGPLKAYFHRVSVEGNGEEANH